MSSYDVPAARRDEMKTKSVVEGESVTLHPGVTKTPNVVMTWYCNEILIAEITGDQSFFSVDTDRGSMSVMEGDSVTLPTGIKTNQPEMIKWYFNGFQIAEITGDQSYTCTDVQCKDGDERFRNRLKLDHQTGSLTITNITNTDSGLYHLQITSRRGKISTRIFNVAVSGVSAAERDEIKRKSVKEGESVTLYTGEIKNPNDLKTWYFNETRIAEITGDQSKICSDVQCKERFRDRLKLDHQTGSLTIMNTRTTDSGDYTLQINRSRFTIMRSFSVSVSAKV
ncbi:uncharacterized protein LOC113040795 [Carassius auratus]|uniref:Uncharacterized protein LOC113040795 n=1 Tax=Carassius auratus TaxID=7957 RepID=A0A6P6J3V3_CARAU|nr:uncharacterized protein LOC113040795 [Carassius auratus]